MRVATRWNVVLALGLACVVAGCGAHSHLRSDVPPAALRPTFLDQFDTLWTRFNDVYPSFAYKRVDWTAQRDRYRARVARVRTQDELIVVLREMLAPLHDQHVWFVDPRGMAVPTYQAPIVPNFDRRRWSAAMRSAGYTPRPGGLGEATVGGYAYFYVSSWRPPVDIETLDLMLQRARDAQGLIIDVRTNAGGSDQTALEFASRFTTRSFAASYREIKTDPRVTDVEMPLARSISPRGPFQFTRPVIVISGRGGLSATESFVAAMRTLPQVTVIGDTTGGASGNPGTYALGNGWQFTVPRWFELAPDKQPIEGRGVAPQIVIPFTSQYDTARDPLIDAAVGLLGERLGVYRMAPASDSAGGAEHPGRPRQ
jgi:hypothetical protein